MSYKVSLHNHTRDCPTFTTCTICKYYNKDAQMRKIDGFTPEVGVFFFYLWTRKCAH